MEESGVTRWRGTGIYGWPDSRYKHLTWRLLRSLKGFDSVPWVCFGDFNEIMYDFEKVGVRRGNVHNMEAFRDACKFCGLDDLGATGVKMTWDNGHRGGGNVKERLDRFLASADWLNMFPLASVRNLARVASDHSPILLCCKEGQRESDKVKIFRFEKMWLRATEFSSVVEETWIDGVLACLKDDPVSILKASNRRRRNQMVQLQDSDGKWVEGKDQVRDLITNYFSDLFSTSSPPNGSTIVDNIDVCLTPIEVCELDKPVTASEIWGALRQMAPDKAPGIDEVLAASIKRSVELRQIHGIKDIIEKYCRLSVIGRSKKRVFQAVAERVKEKLSGWKDKSLSKATVGYMPSYLWRSFLSARELIYKGIRWNLGKGDAINIWEDSWIVGHEDIAVHPNMCTVNYVRELFTDEGSQWNSELVHAIFENDLPKKNCNMLIFPRMPDQFIRHFQRMLLSDFKYVNGRLEQEIGRASLSNIQSWKPPQNDEVLKFNCDASWIPSTKHAAISFVGRDFKGDVWGSGAWGRLVVNSVIEAEARAVLFALDSARTGGVKRIIIEMDSLTLYKALKDGLVLLQI
ncbi:hypothetical protein POM88_032099 [Heracleum sosnowskyi]|uniref:RNase H type-1 domain-containing protein n=1 Tax=Heracleum sosnowskyi TaxID=360622 RepID=A0AAD8HYZ1_9APIA|nr:hypothetical protein POM88_032099 [Heracleum sosnowskyi]